MEYTPLEIYELALMGTAGLVSASLLIYAIIRATI